MRIGKIVKIITRPDNIPAKIPKPEPTPILVPDWPVKKPELVPVSR